MRNLHLGILLSALTLTIFAVPASAQDERVRLSIGAAAATGTGDNLALTASAGYRFLERLSFEVDLTATESSAGRFVQPLAAMGGPGDRIVGGAVGPAILGGPVEAPPGLIGGLPPMLGRVAIFPPPVGRSAEDILLVTTGFRYELPVQAGRLRPYLGGGLGIARTEHDEVRILARQGAATRDIDSVSRTGVAASAGVGASLRVFRGLFVDMDARYFRLGGDRDLTRLGGGVSYRF